MNVTFLCLGGNIGDREKALEAALSLIENHVGQIVSKSEIYETEAWGVTNQQAYLNQCVKVNTTLTAQETIVSLLSIEKDLGRQRTHSLHYEPRTIDLDILYFNNDIFHQPHLTIPHPRLHLRKFVLVPLEEIASDYLHPVLNKTTFNLLKDCTDHSEIKPFKTNS